MMNMNTIQQACSNKKCNYNLPTACRIKYEQNCKFSVFENKTPIGYSIRFVK